jgi:hypothetical protein
LKFEAKKASDGFWYVHDDIGEPVARMKDQIDATWLANALNDWRKKTDFLANLRIMLANQ